MKLRVVLCCDLSTLELSRQIFLKSVLPVPTMGGKEGIKQFFVSFLFSLISNHYSLLIIIFYHFEILLSFYDEFIFSRELVNFTITVLFILFFGRKLESVRIRKTRSYLINCQETKNQIRILVEDYTCSFLHPHHGFTVKFSGRMDEFLFLSTKILSNSTLKTALCGVAILGLHFAVLFGYVRFNSHGFYSNYMYVLLIHPFIIEYRAVSLFGYRTYWDSAFSTSCWSKAYVFKMIFKASAKQFFLY